MASDPAPPRATGDTAAIIVAAGRGTRAGGEIPKQWQQLLDQRVIDWTVDAFRQSPRIGPIVIVVSAQDAGHLSPAPDLTVVSGGETRAASVQAGLHALANSQVSRVLIHDAARACVTPDIIGAVADALDTCPAAAPGAPVTDALWRAEATAPDQVAGLTDRSNLYRAQTPQGFAYADILAAHRAAPPEAADDVAVAMAAGIPVTILPGDPDNLKITTPGDFSRAERILRHRMTDASPDIRMGNGYDVHRFGPGDHVILCGCKIPHDRALQGHSDADVGMHAVTDAIYGALAEGDIGRHFPPSDPQWKGADSRIFLEHAVALADARGYRITNMDCTLICEFPKIGPHAQSMIAIMAEITGLSPDRVSIKATTSERLGFTGRGEGIAALATVSLMKP